MNKKNKPGAGAQKETVLVKLPGSWCREGRRTSAMWSGWRPAREVINMGNRGANRHLNLQESKAHPETRARALTEGLEGVPGVRNGNVKL